MEVKASACLTPAFYGQCKCLLVGYVLQASSVQGLTGHSKAGVCKLFKQGANSYFKGARLCSVGVENVPATMEVTISQASWSVGVSKLQPVGGRIVPLLASVGGIVSPWWCQWEDQCLRSVGSIVSQGKQRDTSGPRATVW